LAAAALGAASTCLPRDASALGPIDLELGLKAGGGTNPLGNPQPPNPLGFGIGARGGVSLFSVYAGLNVMYYFGSSQTLDNPGPSGSVSTTSANLHSLMYGGELGYNIKLAILTIRPQVGLGNYTQSETGISDVNNLYVEPGVTGMIALGTFFLGADANALILPGIKQSDGSTGTSAGFTLHGQVGVKF
jgi:hypothetical protein